MALKYVIWYPQFHILQKCSLRKPALPQRVYERIAQHHTDRRKTLCKTISELENSIPSAASCHPAAIISYNSTLKKKKKICLDLQLKRWISKADWYNDLCLSVLTESRPSTAWGKEVIWQQQNEMTNSQFSTSVSFKFSTSVSFTEVLESDTFQRGWSCCQGGQQTQHHTQ